MHLTEAIVSNLRAHLTPPRQPQTLPRYPIEWIRFVRSPAAYIRSAVRGSNGGDYSPLAAFSTGFTISIAFEVFEARRAFTAIDKITEQTAILILCVAFLLTIHTVCRLLGGTARLAQGTAAIEYMYGFLLPATMAFT